MPRSRSAVARSSEYCQTPPTASAVISTRRMLCPGAARNGRAVSPEPPGSGATLPLVANIIQLEFAERMRPRVLNVTEAVETPKVVVHGAFPRAIVSRPPTPRVFRRSGVREHRHRLVGPHAELLDMLAPSLDICRIIRSRFQQVRLDERHHAFRVNQTRGDVFGRQLRPFVEKITPLDRDALDPRFDRHAARRSKQVEHGGRPEVDARLYSKDHRVIDERLEQLAIGKKDFVDEVDVLDAERFETRDFLEDGWQRTLAVIVAKVVLRTERAVIRAAARHFHL